MTKFNLWEILKMDSRKKKWLNSSKQMNDIRKYISVNGRVIKHSKSLKHTRRKKENSLTDPHRRLNIQECVPASKLSQGLRKKVINKENMSDICYQKDTSKLLTLQSTAPVPVPIPVTTPCTDTSLIPVPSELTPPIPNPINNTVNEIQNTYLFDSIIDGSIPPDLVDKYQLSETSITEILKYDTEQFLKQL